MKRFFSARCLPCVLFALMAMPAVAQSGERASPDGGRLKVFVLAGQSNMQGHGKVAADPSRNEGQGSLEYLVTKSEHAKRAAHLVDEDGAWVARDDVWIWYMGRKGKLTPGYGAREGLIGPELGFGHAVGMALKEQVLIIKVAWGGKSIHKDFRPPSSGGEVGAYYEELVQKVRSVLDDIGSHFPDERGKEYELAGFGWHQGWNDGGKMDHVEEYETNLANLIGDLRKEFDVLTLPVVIASSGFGGWENKNARRVGIMKAQLAVADRPEFKDSVFTVETRSFFRGPEVSPSKQGYHWNHNAETHFLMGDAMGRAMAMLLEGKQPRNSEGGGVK